MSSYRNQAQKVHFMRTGQFKKNVLPAQSCAGIIENHLTEILTFLVTEL